MNGWTQLNTANAALHAKATRKAVEEQTRLMRGQHDDALRAELNREWHEILVERDRVWKEAADRMWRQGWEAGYREAMKDGNG